MLFCPGLSRLWLHNFRVIGELALVHHYRALIRMVGLALLFVPLSPTSQAEVYTCVNYLSEMES